MAVFTEVSFDEAAQLIDGLGLGALRELAPCAGGIENTNYFVDTAGGRYVLTLFERLTAEELPFYLHLMKHFADRGLPVPGPHPDASGSLLLSLKGKPAAVVDRLPGEHHLAPDAADCASLGTLRELSPCAGGIENTNYFVDTSGGRYVLTLFERLTAEELPFYLQLMK
ncbi:MAG TPA: phosphotransferase, partial [Planctomycetota bacterium]|nr:phosphotransferase [Planctomycetota bacterium]